MMKKCFRWVLSLLIMAVWTCCFTLNIPVLAAGEAQLLIDDADLFTEEEESRILSRLNEVSGKRNCSIGIVTASSLGGLEAVDYIDRIIDSQSDMAKTYGIVRLFIYIDGSDETNREVRVATDRKASQYFSDSDDDWILDGVVYDLVEGNYENAAVTYINCCNDILGDSTGDNAANTGSSRGVSPLWLIGDLGIGAVIAMILGGAQRSKLKTVRKKGGASEYKAEGGIHFIVNRDVLFNKRVERRRIERDEPSERHHEHHEAGTTHTTMSGSRHGGRGRKF